MSDRIYHEAGKRDVFLNSDDFQVASKLMLGAAMVSQALDEMRNRGTFNAVMDHCGTIGAEIINNYMRDCGEDFERHKIYDVATYKYSRIGQIVYDTLLKLRDKAEDF